ncbi:hypothetical protein DERF_002404 [Dermatophagoides farinae]|uniref:Uncharacterized protein n=1 Tax=Dermatophagoides farinae TaxID=6954 RepID=A0A922LAL3_DERFA|nr:hypothetical protein DERF_002404 [Dermatophagoides farinae]
MFIIIALRKFRILNLISSFHSKFLDLFCVCRLNFLFLFPVFFWFYFLVIDLNESNEFIDHQYEKDKLKKKNSNGA